jgi:hypothetical protein
MHDDDDDDRNYKRNVVRFLLVFLGILGAEIAVNITTAAMLHRQMGRPKYLKFSNGKINDMGFYEGTISKSLYDSSFKVCMQGAEDPFHFEINTRRYNVHIEQLLWCALISGSTLDDKTTSLIEKHIPSVLNFGEKMRFFREGSREYSSNCVTSLVNSSPN